MSVEYVTYYRISCDRPGCTTLTEPFPTPEQAWAAFRVQDGMMFLPSRDKPLTYLCPQHYHWCHDYYVPHPAAGCQHCSSAA